MWSGRTKAKKKYSAENFNKPIESDAGSTISSGAGPGIADGLNYTSNKFDTENLNPKIRKRNRIKNR